MSPPWISGSSWGTPTRPAKIGECLGHECPMKGLDVPLYRLSGDVFRCEECYKNVTGHLP